MNFFKALRNFMRCAFCRHKGCSVRFSVGSRHYYSYLGFVSTGCPKKLKKKIPYYGLSIKEKNEKMIEDAQKENEND